MWRLHSAILQLKVLLIIIVKIDINRILMQAWDEILAKLISKLLLKAKVVYNVY